MGSVIRYFLNHIGILFGFVLMTMNVYASPQYSTYTAKILKPDGYPLEASRVDFKFTVMDPSASCSIYSELFTSINMQGSNGNVSITLGNGSRSYPASGTLRFTDSFENLKTYGCEQGMNFTSVASSARKIVMQFNDGNGWQTLPAMQVNSVPYASYALKAMSSVSATTATNSLSLNGKLDTDFVSKPVSCSTNQILSFDGVNFVCVNNSGGGGGGGSGITSISAGIPSISIGGTASAPVISITTASAASAGILSASDYIRFDSVTSQTNSASSSAVINTIVKRDSSGNASFNGITTSTISANSTSANSVDIYKSGTANYIRLQAPVGLASSYVLNLPVSAGVSGQVLQTDGAGALSWGSGSQWATSGADINYSSGNVGIGTSSPTSTLDVQSSSGANFIYSTGYGTATPGYFVARGARGTQLSPSAVQANDSLGGVGFRGYGATGFSAGSKVAITAFASENWTDSAQGTHVIFQTTPTGSSTLTERVRITSSGYVGIGTSSPTTALTVAGAITPDVDSSRDIGTLTNRISSVYTRQVNAGANTLDLKGGSTLSWFGGVGNMRFAEGLRLGTGYIGTTAPTDGAIIQGKVAFGLTAPTAKLHIAAGSATSGTAPLKIASGTVMTTPEDGAIEYDGTHLYFTDSTSTRRTLSVTNSASSSSYTNVSQISNPSGSIDLSPSSGNSVIVNQTTSSMGTGTGALVVNGGVGIAENLNVGGNITTTTGTVTGSSLTATAAVTTPVIYGSTVSAGTLSLYSTSHATKGNILLAPTGGNVAIGFSTAPVSTLDVSGTVHVKSGSSTSVMIETLSSATGGPRLELAHNGTGGRRYDLISTGTGNGPGAGKLEFIDITSATTRMVLDQNGNLGIGNSSPTYTLDVSGTIGLSGSGTAIRATRSGTNDSTGRFDIYGNTTDTNGPYVTFFGPSHSVKPGNLEFVSNGTGSIKFISQNGGAWNKWMTILSNGRIGISTETPSTQLEVAGTVKITGGNPGAGKVLTSDAVGLASWVTPSATGIQASNNLSDLSSSATARTNLGLGDSGVTAGTYGSVSAVPSITVDALGRITAATSNAYQYGDSINYGILRAPSGSNLTVSSGNLSLTASNVVSALGYTPAASGTGGSSQWTTNGSKINYMAGNVGIGIANPGYTFDVAGQGHFSGYVAVDDLVSAGRTFDGSVSVGFVATNYGTANGTGSSLSFETYNNGYGGIVNPASISGVMSDGTNGSEKGHLIFNTLQSGALTEQVRITSTGKVGIGVSSPTTKLQVDGAIIGNTNIVATGGSVDLSLSNTHVLQNIGSSTMTLSNMVNGGVYTLIVQDQTSRTYSFSGCANSRYSPANAATTVSSDTIYGITTVQVSGTWYCYITWSSGFQ